MKFNLIIKKCSKYYINFDNLNYSFEFDKCQYSLDELKQFVEYLNIKKEHLYSDNDGNYVPSVTLGGIIKDEEIREILFKVNENEQKEFKDLERQLARA